MLPELGYKECSHLRPENRKPSAGQTPEKYSIFHISTGDIFRREIKGNTALGQEVTKYLNAGKLVPDEVTFKVLSAEIENNPELRPLLKAAGLLKRDPRSVERKKPGKKKARKSFQFSKR